jgi:hypothetical protein
MMTIEDIADTPGISADSFSEPADRFRGYRQFGDTDDLRRRTSASGARC